MDLENKVIKFQLNSRHQKCLLDKLNFKSRFLVNIMAEILRGLKMEANG